MQQRARRSAQTLGIMTNIKSIARWVALLVMIVLGIFYLNGALFRVWIADGPPNSNPEGWLFSAFNYFCAAAAFIVGGVGVFLLIGRLPSLHKGPVVLLVIAAAFGITPFVREFVAIDRCLDASGQGLNRSYAVFISSQSPTIHSNRSRVGTRASLTAALDVKCAKA
jgi:hypothetical protein